MSEEFFQSLTSFIRTMLLIIWSYILNSVISIQNFLAVILILAIINTIFGWLADEGEWSMRKACQAGLFLLGYEILLIITNIIGTMMNVTDIGYYCSWITWVMIYFYATNILRNWKNVQPGNRVIAFMYWVATAKFIKNINYMDEYLKQSKENNK